MSLRRTATTRPSFVFTVSLGADTAQHSVGSSSTNTLQSVFAATRFDDSWAHADPAIAKHAAAPNTTCDVFANNDFILFTASSCSASMSKAAVTLKITFALALWF